MDPMLSITHFILPACLLLAIYFWKSKCKLDWLIKQVAAVSYLALLHIAGNWYEINYYLRYVYELVYIIGAVISYLRVRKEKFLGNRNIPLWLMSMIIVLLCAVLYASSTPLAAFSYDTKPVKLAFPFNNGVYVIINGGNGEKSKFMNQHFYASQFVLSGTTAMVRYAVDIQKMNAFGFLCDKPDSKELNDYPTYGEILYSPCDGNVIRVSDGLSDGMIGPNIQIGSGNTIVIQKDDIYILIGHLQNGSISVKAGDTVKTGQPIAKAGNSSSGIPHTHIQATRYGYSEGVPILFDGWFPVKNDLFFR